MNTKTLMGLFFFCIVACYSSGQAAPKNLKLLFVTDKFPWASRPFINNQIAGLIDRGHEVYILATTKVKDSKMTPCLVHYKLTKHIFYEELPAAQRVFDAILIQFPQSKGNEPLWDMYKNKSLKGKLVVFFRGEDLSAMIKTNSHRYDNLFPMGDLFLPVCHYFKKRLIKLGCNPKKIHVIHSAIDCDQFCYSKRHVQSDKRVQLVTACRLVPKKGVKFAILAAEKLHKRYPNLTYSIIGDGPDKQMLSGLITFLGAQDYIHLVGKLPHHKVAKKLEDADIFILPSVTAFHGDQEGIPNALMEAMASGLPVVSSYHSGIPELIEHGTRGLLAPERDVDALVENISYLIEHPDVRKDMTRYARAYVEQEHNYHVENDKLEKLLLKLCNA